MSPMGQQIVEMLGTRECPDIPLNGMESLHRLVYGIFSSGSAGDAGDYSSRPYIYALFWSFFG
jgi:hypothetical protein